MDHHQARTDANVGGHEGVRLGGEWKRKRWRCAAAGRTSRRTCFGRLTDVLVAQGQTIDVVHVLRPLAVVVAGAGEFDPY